MNMKSLLVVFAMLATYSYNTMAATELTAAQADTMTPVGTVSVSGIAQTPEELQAAIAKKADEEGAKSYYIVEEREGGSSHATAAIYK